jgi:esterase/lipase
MRNLLILCVFGVLLISCATFNHINPYQDMEIKQFGDNRAYEFKNHDSNRLIIIIEGSGLHSVLGEKHGERWSYTEIGAQLLQVLQNDYTLLILEKFNWEAGNSYRYNEEVTRKYSADNLLECYITVINAYLANENYKSVFIIGASEGAILLPVIYDCINNKSTITGLISIAGGGLPLYESYKILSTSSGLPKIRRETFSKITTIQDSEMQDDFFETLAFGMSKMYFYSMMKIKPIEYYKNIDIPILFVHGEKDKNVPVESTEFVKKTLPEKPFDYIYYKNMEHGPSNYSQAIKFREEIALWIKNNDVGR